MTGVQVDASDALEGLAAMRVAILHEVPEATFRAGAMAQTLVRANASSGTHPPGDPHIPGTGPGPNVATGDYRRSIAVTDTEQPGEANSDVDSNAVQKLRLELGFIGRDSAGRLYRQRPYPHWAPAGKPAEAFANQFMHEAADAIDHAFGGA